MKPVIGITSAHDTGLDRYFLARYYTNAVEWAGGISIILPPLNKSNCQPILEKIDGLLLSGGSDVDPLLFGEEPHPELREITPERDAFEISITHQAIEKDIPLLAICRGIQVLNIAVGGAIIQDIGSEISCPVKHSQDAPRWYPSHWVDILPDSLLYDIFNCNRIRVNSFHHQSIKEAAKGFRSAAWSSDGIIEAIESVTHSFILGVQWHPECMVGKDPYAYKLFQAFIQAAVQKM